MNSAGLKAACEAAARVNAMLLARGKLRQETPPLLPQASNPLPSPAPETSLFTARVEINSSPPSARNLLTKSSVQDELCRGTDATISTKGRYIPPGESLNIGERPLYLFVQATSLAAVNRAVDQIYGVIRQHRGVVPGQITFTQPTPPHQFYQDRVYLNIDPVLPAFNIQLKINGPNESYLNHIRTETGSRVTLRGRGSGHIEQSLGQESPEPLHLYIIHHKPDGLRAARSLANNLVETVQQEYSQWLRSQQPYSTEHPPTPQLSPVSKVHHSGWDSTVRRKSLLQPPPPPTSHSVVPYLQPAPPVYSPTPAYSTGVPPPSYLPVSYPTPAGGHVNGGGIPAVITYPLPPPMVPPPPGTTPLPQKRKFEEEEPQVAKRPVPAPVPPPSTTIMATPSFLLSGTLPPPAVSLPPFRLQNPELTQGEDSKLMPPPPRVPPASRPSKWSDTKVEEPQIKPKFTNAIKSILSYGSDDEGTE